jgi:hypothetical protein
MPIQSETRRAGDAAGLGDDAFPGGNCNSELTPKAHVAQAKNLPSAAVGAALKRAQQRQRDHLLDIKRGSLWTVAAMARDHLDSVLWSLEQPEFDEVFPCAKVFVEHAKSVAKLANDFESERQAIVRQAAVR